ncbi:uncharacterized protein FOMMEDRAFT_16767, partial [Fomitiporia mediterranea MF3/22]|uniref:uncharacterized protein n=1 Tax=Fomitiporia mediterranea (strain MF3/22) TaxID=694068 RepID=UPI00044087FC
DYTVLQHKVHKQQSIGMLATMSRYNYSHGTLSLTLTVHDTVSNIGSSSQPLTPLLSLSIPSTSLSLFEPEPLRDTPLCSQSIQCVCTNTALPVAQISLFNTLDLNPSTLLTLALYCYSQPLQLVQSYNPHTCIIQLVGTEQQLKHSDEDYIKRSENASILFYHKCCLKKNKAEAAHYTLESDSPSAYSSLYGCPSDICTQCVVVCVKWKWWTLLILRWVIQSD